MKIVIHRHHKLVDFILINLTKIEFNAFQKFRSISGIHIRKNRIFCKRKHFQKDLRTLSLHKLAFC